MLRGAMVTADRYRVGTVVCVREPDMKQAWCLAASRPEATAKGLTGYHGSRWAPRLACAIVRTSTSAWGAVAASTGMHGLQPDPTMPERWLQPLMRAFTRLLDQQPLFSRTLGLV